MLRNFILVSPLFICCYGSWLYDFRTLRAGRKIFGTENLANFGFAFPSWPVNTVEFHELLRAFNRFLLGLQVKNCKPADDFLGFGVGPVGCGQLPARNPD